MTGPSTYYRPENADIVSAGTSAVIAIRALGQALRKTAAPEKSQRGVVLLVQQALNELHRQYPSRYSMDAPDATPSTSPNKLDL